MRDEIKEDKGRRDGDNTDLGNIVYFTSGAFGHILQSYNMEESAYAP